MKFTASSIIGFALCAILVAGCGDDAIPGFGGGTICASDDPEVGNTIECPSGDKTIDFCVNTGNANCYYLVDGEQIGCGNCLESGSINDCAVQAVERCD